ncbi:methionyl-tRNA formyltransferase, mitochondrial [Lycorma delicatula]|uniref:methionyl-tRNA formyltransferase, mitochondrial n=1 Tax=Lycorma delicatula TaxID=130591 RepID=UPI003F519130
MSCKLVVPSVKYVVFSYYLVVAGCRNISFSSNINKFINSLDKNYKFKSHIFNNSSLNFSTRKRPEEPPWKILFFGTDNFSLACLQPLNAKLNTGTLMSGLGVITSVGSVVHKFAESEKLPIYSWPPDDNILNNYDLGIVVSYGKLIPENIINALPFGVLNVHASLLPRWRGAAPISYAILNGDAETGVTIMLIKPHKFDVGDTVRQYRCAILPNETTPELSNRLAHHAGLLLMECIRDIPRCIDMAVPQPNEGVTYAPKVTGKLSTVDWKKLSAKQVYDLHRAISHKYILSTTWFDKPVRLYNIEMDHQSPLHKKVLSNVSSHKSALKFLNSSDPLGPNIDENKLNINNKDVSPGKISYNRNKQILKIQCADGNWVMCNNLKVSNGRIMSNHDFYNGFLTKKDQTDWFFE